MLILDENDIHSLALVAWKEARGQGPAGMAAVMHVCINRTGHPGFASTLHDVIYGKNQFTSMSVPSDGQFNLQPPLTDTNFQCCLSEASSIQLQPDPTHGAHYYANLKYSTSGWFFTHIVNDPVNHPQVAVIGQHTFYL